jgi:predicted metalloprotease with PDZ domain
MAAKKSSALPAGIHYRVEPADLHAHLFRVTLTIARPAALQQVSLPVWIPGSYLVREFSKNLQKLHARQGTRGAPCSSWTNAAGRSKPIRWHRWTLSYEVYALDNSVRTAWLDAQRGFFNGTSLCLRVHGQEAAAHALEVTGTPSTATWHVATGLTPNKINRKGFGTYLAAHYDELVDCPVEMGVFWSGEFRAGGVPHRFVVAGAAGSFDGKRLLADAQKICEEAIRFWHGKRKPPHKSYLFMLNAVADGYGGLEHRNSTALICKRQDLPAWAHNACARHAQTARGLHHAAGADQPRILPHLERQAPAPGRLGAATTTPGELHRAAVVL